MTLQEAWAGVPKARLVVMVGIVAVLCGGPFARHVLHVKSPYVRGWMMYSGFALGNYCQVAFYERTEAGDERVDRLAVLGHTSLAAAPASVRRLGKTKDVESQGRQLCKKLGPGTDLRVDARCSSKKGWTRALHREANLCAPARAVPERP